MEREKLLRLAERVGIVPWVRHEWTGRRFVHTDEGMEGDLACLMQFYTLAVEQERERAAMICHQLRDVKYPADDIAARIMAKT
jgi:ubiquinone biosynthesis protein UbiJ